MMPSRITRQKKELTEIIAKISDFFTAEDLLQRAEGKGISLATIYRMLNRMESEKRLYSYICDRKKVYSKEDSSHCHFVCEETGKIIHFRIDSIDFLKDKIPGKIRSFQLEVRGVCERCNR